LGPQAAADGRAGAVLLGFTLARFVKSGAIESKATGVQSTEAMAGGAGGTI